jgi:cold-inducible RNA-binding protein
MRLFIGNLGSEVTKDMLVELFSEYGRVNAAIIQQHDNGGSGGYGYVEMAAQADAEAAIRALNKKQLMKQFISVSKALHSKKIA